MTFRCSVWALAYTLLALGCRDPGRTTHGDEGRPDAGPGDTFEVETCGSGLMPLTEGECRVTGGTGSMTVFRGNVIGPSAGYEGGEVVVDGDQIVCTGCDCSATPNYADATVIECPEAAISPALINPHDHLTFTEGTPFAATSTRYNHRHDWRGSIPTPSNAHGTSDTSGGMRWGELRMLFSGTTAMIGAGSATGLIRNLDDLQPDERSRGLKQAEYTTFSLGDRNETFHADCTWNYDHSESEVAKLDHFVPHVAEGINDVAAEEFRCQSSNDPGAEDFTEKNSAFIHAIGLSTANYLRMARGGTQLIWSPRSNISLYGMTAQVTTFERFGGIIALGTDWTYSGSANTLRELACAAQFNQKNLGGFFSAKQLHDMATRNAAIATGNGALLGTLEEGKLADIAIYAGHEPGLFHRAVIEASNLDVLLVVQGGKPMYGRTPLVEAMGEHCDGVTVCGDQREVCSTREFGVTFAQIQSQVQNDDDPAYDAFFCDPIPYQEPTCTPSRPGEFSGVPSGVDADGDGFADDVDNCPDVFNPVRPIDEGVQPDQDGDGIGDPCDTDPLIADLDGDGKDNDQDNCPFAANADQGDGDSDGRGDVCDGCPSESNPTLGCGGASGQMATITDVQNGTIGEDVDVTITGVVVTGVSGNDVTVQDPAAASPEYSGVLVFLGATPAVNVGDVVDVSGRTTEFFGNTELTSASVTATGSTMSIAPAEVTVAQATSEPYENVLVTIPSGGTITDPYDCTADDSGCTDTDLWSVTTGPDEIVLYDHFYTGSDWDSHKGTTPVTGVTMYRRNSWRLMPRSATDF